MGSQNECAKMEALAAPAPDKHVLISNAIDSLESVIEHARALLSRIEGSDRPGEDKAVRGTPALLEMLNEASPRINGIESETHNLLDQIESTLFN